MPHPFRKPFIAAMTCAALLSAQGWIGAAGAAEWPTWPRPIAPAPETTPGEPGPAPLPEAPPSAPAPAPSAPAPEAAKPGTEGAAKAGEAAGKKTAGGIKAGTIGWAALIAAGVVGIAIAVGGGGGGGGTTTNH